MSDIRYSVMVLPRRSNGEILLQTWTDEKGTVTDGFGSFYNEGENPEKTAMKVLGDFGVKAKISKAAQLQYYMNKPTGLVDLKITVYFADITEEPPVKRSMDWFASTDIPYTQIHPATGKWLPLILDGKVPLKAIIRVDQPGDHATGTVADFSIDN